MKKRLKKQEHFDTNFFCVSSVIEMLQDDYYKQKVRELVLQYVKDKAIKNNIFKCKYRR